MIIMKEYDNDAIERYGYVLILRETITDLSCDVTFYFILLYLSIIVSIITIIRQISRRNQLGSTKFSFFIDYIYISHLSDIR